MAANIDGRRLIVWHGERHDDFTTTEVLLKPNESAQDWTRDHSNLGGFWYDGTKFVPWHRVNYIELDI
jgi:hypothetical protein